MNTTSLTPPEDRTAQSLCCQHRRRHGVNQSFSDGDHTAHHLSAGHKCISRYYSFLRFYGLILNAFPIWFYVLISRCISLNLFFPIQYLMIFSPFFTACCRNYMKTKIPFLKIKGYSVQTVTGLCPISAIMWVSPPSQQDIKDVCPITFMFISV